MRLDIARLRGQIADDRAAAELQFTELAGLADLAESAGSRARAAIALHHGYSAIEAILERCTVALEGGVPKGPAYHRELLDGAARDVPGVRRALLSKTLVRDLRDLLGFRHFFRHAYDAPFDAQRLDSLRTRALALRPLLASELDHLDAYLAELASSEPSP